MTQSPFSRTTGLLVIKQGGLHDSHPNTPTPQSCFPCPPLSSTLLLGHSEWLLHLDFAAVVDDDVFKRLIAAICLCALDLLHHILEDKKRRISE